MIDGIRARALYVFYAFCHRYFWRDGQDNMHVVFNVSCSVDAVALATPGSLGSSPLALVRPETWRFPTSYLFAEMEGTVVEELLADGKVVGIGPHGDSDFTEYTGLVGQLCQPIGKRQVVFLNEVVTAEEVEELGIDGILWDASIPLAEGLMGFPAEEVGEFLVVEVK